MKEKENNSPQKEENELEFFIEQLHKAAGTYEKEIAEDIELAPIQAPDVLYDDIVGELKRQGVWETKDDITKDKTIEMSVQDIYQMLPKEDRKALEMGKKYRQRSRFDRVKKIIGIAAVIVICVFGLSMTSAANRKYVLGVVTSIFGDNVNISLGGLDQRLEISRAEEEVAVKIKESIGINIPVMTYRPERFRYIGYEVMKEAGVVTLTYMQDGKNFIIQIYTQETENLGQQKFSGKKVTEVYNDEMEINMDIWEFEKVGGMMEYATQFLHGKSYYVINGEFTLVEFENLIKNLVVNNN